MNWKQFKAKWGNCKACELHKTRKKIVLARGSLPCDVLFIGEAPGDGEDTWGIPFWGEAGHRILNPILEKAFQDYEEFTYALTNILACIPKNPETGKKYKKATDIPKAYPKACKARLDDFVRVCKPKAIVWVGGYAAKYGPSLETENLPQVEINHPASLLPGRINIAEQGFVIQQCVARIRSILYDLKYGAA